MQNSNKCNAKNDIAEIFLRNIRTIVAYCLDVYMYILKVFMYTCNGEVFLLVRKDMDVNEHERIFRVRVMVSYATFKNISAIHCMCT
jgi:hypothetical protein